MTNTNTNTAAYTVPAPIAKEGKALSAAWRKAENAAERTLAKSTAAGGLVLLT